MGKRFGRNQRRRAREVEQELGQLRVAYGMTEGLCRHQGNKIRDLESSIQLFARALGPNFIGLSPRKLEMEAMRMADHDTLRMMSPSGDVIESAVMHTRSRSNNITDQAHFIVHFAGKEIGYAVSMAALYDTDEKVMARHMVEQMAPRLLADIRKEKARG